MGEYRPARPGHQFRVFRQPGRRRAPGRSDRNTGVRARRHPRRRRLDDRRHAHRQHVSQLEPDEHEPVGADLRRGQHLVLGTDARIGHQRRDHERDSEVGRQRIPRLTARQRIRAVSPGQQRERSASCQRRIRHRLAEEAVRHQWGHRRPHQARQALVLFHVAVLHERVLPWPGCTSPSIRPRSCARPI